MIRYHGRHRAPNRRHRATAWLEGAWAFIRASTQILAVAVVYHSLQPQFWLHT